DRRQTGGLLWYLAVSSLLLRVPLVDERDALDGRTMSGAWLCVRLFCRRAMNRRFRRWRSVRLYFLFRNRRLGRGRLMRGNGFLGGRFFCRCFCFCLCCHFTNSFMAQAS